LPLYLPLFLPLLFVIPEGNLFLPLSFPVEGQRFVLYSA
jgi:hypothetical protein